MDLLAFVVLLGLGLVMALTYRRQLRNRDRWPYNFSNPSDTSGTGGSDANWSPTTNTLIAAGTLTVLGEGNSAVSAAHPATETSEIVCDTPSSSWSDHGATGSWGESGDSGGFDGGGGGD